MLTSVQELQRGRQPSRSPTSRQEPYLGRQPPQLPPSYQEEPPRWQPPPLPTSRQDAPPTSFSPVSCTPTNVILSSGALEARFQLLQEQQQEQRMALQAHREEYLTAIDTLRDDIAQARSEIQELRAKPSPSNWAGRPAAYSGLKDHIAPEFAESNMSYSDVKGSSLSCYTFGPSIWDAAVMCFFKEVCPADKIILVFGILINHGLQMILLAVIHFDMLENPVPLEKAEQMLDWRATVGHSHETFDDVKGLTLIQKVCTHSIWSFEMNEYEVMYRYLFMPIPGYILSLLALILWVLTTTREYRNVMEQALAIMNLPSVPRGQRCIIKEEGGLRIVGIEKFGRWVALLVLCLPRLAIDVMICIVGCQYLAQTPSLENIVLNAVALAFVLDVDEQLYDVLCTQRIRTMLEDLRPLPCGQEPQKCMGSLQWKDLLRYVLCIGAVLLSYRYYLVPFYYHVSGAANALCGGEYDFHFEGGTSSQSTIWLQNLSDFHGNCLDDYRPVFHPAYTGDLFKEHRNTSSSDLVKARIRVVLNYAYSKGCSPGEVLQPKNVEVDDLPRACSQLPPVLGMAIKNLTSGVYPGAARDPPRCNQFSPENGDGVCAIQKNNTEACLWTALSEECEGEPPGDIHRRACSRGGGTGPTPQEVEQSCEVWAGFGSTSPYYNCRVVAMCNNTRDYQNCFILRGNLYFDMALVPGLEMPTKLNSYYDTAALSLKALLKLPIQSVLVGEVPQYQERYGTPLVPGPSTSAPAPGLWRIPMRFTIWCPVTFLPEAFFQTAYEASFKEEMLSRLGEINATLAPLVNVSLKRVSFNNASFLSNWEYETERHALKNNPSSKPE